MGSSVENSDSYEKVKVINQVVDVSNLFSGGSKSKAGNVSRDDVEDEVTIAAARGGVNSEICGDDADEDYNDEVFESEVDWFVTFEIKYKIVEQLTTYNHRQIYFS